MRSAPAPYSRTTRLVLLGIAALLLLWVAGPRVRGLLISSAGVVLPATALAMAVGVPLGIFLAKTDLPGRRSGQVVILALLVLPLHVWVAGWMAALDSFDGWYGAVGVHALAAIPWVTLLSAVALRTTDRRREEQALLDAPAWRVLTQVSLRDATPALVATACWVAVTATTEMAATDLFRVRTFAEEVYTQAALGAFDAASPGRGAIGLLAGVLLLALLVGTSLSVLANRLRGAMTESNEASWRVPVTKRRAIAGWGLGAVLMMIGGVPIASLAYQAGEQRVQVQGEWQREWSATKLVRSVAAAPWQHRRELTVSITLAVVVATSSVLIGGSIAWYGRRTPRLALTLIAIGLAVPGPVVGLATIRFLNQPLDSLIAPLGLLYGTWFAPWLAQSVRIVPMAALILWPAAMSLSQEVLDAARADGAGPLARLFRIAVPMRWPAIGMAWLASFILSIGELSATSLVVPPGTPPLSVRLLSLLHYGVEDRVAAICLLLFAMNLIAAWLVIWLYSRKSRRDGSE